MPSGGGVAQRHDFRVGLAGALRMALAQHPAPVGGHDHAADAGIGLGQTDRQPGLRQGLLHERVDGFHRAYSPASAGPGRDRPFGAGKQPVVGRRLAAGRALGYGSASDEWR